MGKTVLITGSSRGIGRECARLFSKNGYDILINCRERTDLAEKLKEEIRSFGVAAKVYKCDVSNSDEVFAMFEDAEKCFGGVDILINNAAVSSFSLLQTLDEKEWDRTFDVNVKGMYLCSKYAIDHMVHNKYGHIINISSMWGICGASCEVHYSASKSAVIGFTKALARELAPSGIRVNCVAPGVIATDMNAHLSKDELDALCSEIPLGYIGSPEDIAKAVFFLASSDYITGEVLSVNGGMVI